MERKARAGVPVRCGEGIGRRGLLDHIEPKPEWICNTIKKAVMISPSGIRIELKGTSEDFILDREKMDSDLVKEAINSGVSFFSETPVTSVQKKGEIYDVLLPIKHSLPGSLFWQTGWNQDWPGS